MALSVMSKVALCVCPPVALATTVAAVPPVKRAVHHATAKPSRTAAARPAQAGNRVTDVPCVPVAPVGVPVPVAPTPLVTFADRGVTDLADVPPIVPGAGTPTGFGGGFPPIFTPVGTPPVGNPPIGTPTPEPTPTPTPTPVPTPTPTPTPESPIPEPATWMLMIGGFAIAGVALRRRRMTVRGRAVAGTGGVGFGSFLSTGAGAGEAVGTLAAAPSLAATVSKVALCVCPPALMAGTVVAVPPVRSAVHAATAPIINTAAAIPTVTLLPCPVVVVTSADSAPIGFASQGQVAVTSSG